MAPRTTRTVRGFTIVELIAVLVILALLSSVAATRSCHRLDNPRGEAAAAQLERNFRFARERALSMGRTHWALFDMTAETCAILVDNPASPGFAGAVTFTDPTTHQAMIERFGLAPYEGVTLSWMAGSPQIGNAVGWDKNGRPIRTDGSLWASASGVTVTWASSSKNVVIEPGTGYPHR